jgi:HK97 gp10 family phage protein
MSVAITIQVEFADKVVMALEESFPSALNDRVSNAMLNVGYVMQTDAQRWAPRRTGYMAGQISFETLGYSAWSFRLVGRAPYTIFQEFGTRYIQPRLFMTQSIQGHQQEMVQAIQDAVSEAIRDAFGT